MKPVSAKVKKPMIQCKLIDLGRVRLICLTDMCKRLVMNRMASTGYVVDEAL